MAEEAEKGRREAGKPGIGLIFDDFFGICRAEGLRNGKNVYICIVDWVCSIVVRYWHPVGILDFGDWKNGCFFGRQGL